MCLLILALDTVSDAPLFVAANRDEAVRRPSLPPEKVEGDGQRSAYLAPTDVQAGGTWIGVNDRQTFVAVTNRPKQDIPPSPPSRGTLCRSLLEAGDLGTIIRTAWDEFLSGHYAGCNLIVASPNACAIIEAGDSPRMHRPERGVWIVSNGPLDDPADARSRFVADYLTGMEDGLDQWLPRTEALLAHHATQGSPDVCLHRGEYGTVSSTTVALTGSPEGAVFRYTPGPPCQSETIDFSPALQKLLSDSRED